LDQAGTNPDHAVFTPNGRMSEVEIGIRATMDREESKKLSERTSDNHARAALQGRPRGGGKRAFGYELDRVTVCEPEADLIRQAAGRILAGESAWGIARSWNVAGIKSGSGGHWSAQTLKRVLRSPRIAGLREHRGDIVRVDGVPVKAVWEPILDPDTWTEVGQTIEQNPSGQLHRPAAGGGRARSFGLNGFVFCGRCKARMSTRSRNGGRREYTCSYPESSGQSDSCNRCVIFADAVEDFVLEQVVLGTRSRSGLAVLRLGRFRSRWRRRGLGRPAGLPGRPTGAGEGLVQGRTPEPGRTQAACCGHRP
jgi:hypothetical protein